MTARQKSAGLLGGEVDRQGSPHVSVVLSPVSALFAPPAKTSGSHNTPSKAGFCLFLFSFRVVMC